MPQGADRDGPIYLQSAPGRSCRPRRVLVAFEIQLTSILRNLRFFNSLNSTRACALDFCPLDTLGFSFGWHFCIRMPQGADRDGPIYLQSAPGRSCRPRRVLVAFEIQSTLVLGSLRFFNSLNSTRACALDFCPLDTLGFSFGWHF